MMDRSGSKRSRAEIGTPNRDAGNRVLRSTRSVRARAIPVTIPTLEDAPGLSDNPTVLHLAVPASVSRLPRPGARVCDGSSAQPADPLAGLQAASDAAEAALRDGELQIADSRIARPCAKAVWRLAGWTPPGGGGRTPRPRSSMRQARPFTRAKGCCRSRWSYADRQPSPGAPGGEIASPSRRTAAPPRKDEPLVGVHPLVGDGGDLGRGAEQSGDEVLGDLAQAQRVGGVVEGVRSPSNSDRCVCMPLPGWSLKGFGMKVA